MQHPVMHTAKHLFGFHNERFIMALHLQVHGYILNRKKAQHHKSNHTRKNHKRDFGRGLWVTTVCAGAQAELQASAPRSTSSTSSSQPTKPRARPFCFVPTGRGVCQGLSKCEKKKEKGLKHRKKVMQRDTERDLYTGSFKLCRAARGTKLTV